MSFKESTWSKITQVVLPGLVLFSALAYMHGPGYVAFFQKKLLAYSMPRDSMWGPVKYNVRLKAEFVSEFGDDCEVYVLTDLDPANNASTNRQELILVDKWSRVVDRQVTTDVGAIRSTHLSPQDGYAMLEVVRNIPDNRRQAEILHYQVTAEQIAMVNTETRDLAPEWDWRHGPPRRGRGDHDDRRRRWQHDHEWTPEQIEKWKRHRERWEERRRDSADVAMAKHKRERDDEDAQARRQRKQRNSDERSRSEDKKDVQRSRAMGSDDQRLLDVSRLGGARYEAAELVAAPL